MTNSKQAYSPKCDKPKKFKAKPKKERIVKNIQDNIDKH